MDLSKNKNSSGWWWIVVAVVTYSLDRIIKLLVITRQIPETRIFDWLYINLRYNDGMAFGLGSGYGLLISLIGIIIFLYFLLQNWRDWLNNFGLNIGIGLVLGGAFSNIVDRLYYGGRVVDYLDFTFYSVLNLADIAIVVGLVVIVGLYWKLNPEGS